jgi:hypothetical protein
LRRFDRWSVQGPPNGTSRAALDGKVAQASWPQAQPALLPWPVHGSKAELELSHAGAGAPWAAVQIKAAVAGGTAVSHGISVTKKITPVEQRVAGRWSEGDVMKVTLTFKSRGNASWLAITDPIPSGATILGKGLGGESALAKAAGADSSLHWWTHPSHVERGSDTYRAYFRRVSTGDWTISYLVRLNNAGSFRFPATRVEAMYAPEIFAEAPNPVLEVGP